MSAIAIADPSAPRAARSTYAGIAALLAGACQGDGEATIAACEGALARDPSSPAALFGLAVVAVQQGELATAAALLTRAHDIDPDEGVYAEVLATVYAMAGQLADATYFAKLSMALGLDEATLDLLPPKFPRFAHAFSGIAERPLLAAARRHLAQGQTDLAANRLLQHLAFEPNHTESQREFAAAAFALGQPWETANVVSMMQNAGAATAADLSLLARAHAAMGDAAAAEVQHRQAMAGAPEDAAIAAVRLVDMPLVPGVTVESLRDAGADWERRFGSRAETPSPAPASGKRTRIGFLCSALADARDKDLLADLGLGLPADRYELFAYGFGEVETPRNAVLRAAFKKWRNCAELDADTLAFSIRSDGIDVLFDLGGHRSPLQLLALAQRPAPLQVAWLSGAAPLGLSSIDAVLADAATDPDGVAEKDFAHRLYRLPHGLRAYRRPAAGIATPAAGGGVCFGADVGLDQLHPDLCAAWARILKAAPKSSLLLQGRGFADQSMVRRLIDRFAPHGVGEQIDVFFGLSEEFYSAIDLALAPFVAQHPYAEAAMLAHGVPVIALAGRGRHRRQASGLLVNAGLSRFAAGGADAYEALALALASAADARAKARSEVKRAIDASPVFQPQVLSAAFERAIAELSGRQP